MESECKSYCGDRPFEIILDLPQALERALQTAGPQDVILVTGSVFVVAETIGVIASEGRIDRYSQLFAKQSFKG